MYWDLLADPIWSLSVIIHKVFYKTEIHLHKLLIITPLSPGTHPGVFLYIDR